MAFSAIIKPTDYFNTKLYTGNFSTNAITGVGFQPDLTWIKTRTTAGEDHYLFDVIRGATNYMHSNTVAAQGTNSATLTAFGSDGFTVGANNSVNKSGEPLVSWNWKANGAGSSNTDGSITSTVSVNTTSGFSISTYTGNGTSGATIGHGLGVAPAVVLVKRLNATSDWVMYHKGMGASKFIVLNTTAEQASSAGIFYNTAPTSSIFYVGSDGATNASGGTYVAYCFADVQGFSKMGSYVGNGSNDGSFIYTGFKPAFVLIRGTELPAGTDWYIFDSKREGYNLNDTELQPNNSGIESTDQTSIDILSNGFKCRNSNNNTGGNGEPYIYMAFAEAPFVANSGESIPTTAR
jgi:hypothetical protein